VPTTIALRARLKTTRLTFQNHHVVDEFDRNPEAASSGTASQSGPRQAMASVPGLFLLCLSSRNAVPLQGGRAVVRRPVVSSPPLLHRG
jgi:hypothetical protein